jgi:flagellar basal-body rod modification protein FlgD
MKGAIDVPSGTTSLQLAIKDASGQLIRRMTLPTTSGLSEFSWDGIADNGTRAAAGDYTFEAVANVSGQSRSLETLMSGRVNSVTIDSSNNLVLNTSGLGSRSLSDVRRIM